MTSTLTKFKTRSSLPAGDFVCDLELTLPEKILTKEEKSFFPRTDRWSLHDGGTTKTILFAPFKNVCTEQHIVGLKKILIHLLGEQALVSASNFAVRYLWLCKFTFIRNSEVLVDSLSAEDCIAYRSTLAPKDEYKLHQVRGVIKAWSALGYHGIDNDVPKVLGKLKLKKNRIGTAIRTRDPRKGPFNNEEFEDIINYVINAYADGHMPIDELVLCNLALAFGARPISFASMRLEDFTAEENEYGISEYYLKIPKGKRHNGGRRTHFIRRKLEPEFGHMVKALKDDVLRRFEMVLAQGFNLKDLPFFASNKAEIGYITPSIDLLLKMKVAFTRGSNWPTIKRPGYEGELLHINVYRFRYTVGTRMAEEGKTLAQIAEALGHNALASAKVYMKHTEVARNRINDAVKGEISELVKYWKGELISQNDETEKGFNPGNRIRFYNDKLCGNTVGNCGKSGFCGGLIPVPCYKCRSFQPWIEAPHEDVLRWLLHERKRKMDLGLHANVIEANDEVIIILVDLVQTIRKMNPKANTQKELTYV